MAPARKKALENDRETCRGLALDVFAGGANPGKLKLIRTLIFPPPSIINSSRNIAIPGVGVALRLEIYVN